MAEQSQAEPGSKTRHCMEGDGMPHLGLFLGFSLLDDVDDVES